MGREDLSWLDDTGEGIGPPRYQIGRTSPVPAKAPTMVSFRSWQSAAREFLVARARQDSAIFASLSLRDEVTGQPVSLAPMHRAMHRLWSSGDRSVCWAFPEGGKSQNLVARMAWEIGRNPALRCALLSGTEAQAQNLLRALVIVMQSPAYAEIFPGVSIVAKTVSEFTVAPRPATLKDPTCFAAAHDQSSNLGKRVELAGLDDVTTLEGTRSALSRDRAYSDLLTITSSRIAPGGKVFVVGTCFHPDDAPARLSRLRDWKSARFPVLNDDGTSAWPERWPLGRIERRRAELGILLFQAVMMCEPHDEASLAFPLASIERALSNGLATQYSPIGGRTVVGIDPAFTSRASSDESGLVLVTIDSDHYRHLCQVEGIRVHHEYLVARAVEMCRLNRAVCYIENNAAGGIICDMIAKQVPCKGLNTSQQSKASRIEALAMELASGRWVFRQPLGYPDPELTKLVGEMQTFSADPGRHMGDRISALLIACEGARLLENRPKGGFHHLDLLTR